MDERTPSEMAILKRIRENLEINDSFQDHEDYSDDCYSDYADDSGYGDSSGNWS